MSESAPSLTESELEQVRAELAAYAVDLSVCFSDQALKQIEKSKDFSDINFMMIQLLGENWNDLLLGKHFADLLKYPTFANTVAVQLVSLLGQVRRKVESV